MEIVVSNNEPETDKFKQEENEEHMIPVNEKQDVPHVSSVLQPIISSGMGIGRCS